ncbi:hypothetical protein Q9Q94_04690 [Uliginosibacterium sp. 31-16]|uniref:RCC1 domain-containing protein n=1 Tax=Uliginosibacterium sp. 31-16 TaxID=3068315 RepID=UPI00273F6BC9|nr:RCC1 domain-containing protein [Uliginosibacterium sp. 31-16]MDP5238812.1 hypothetical protein [Uliginosibacterium sp. 31-16]
MLTTTFYDDFSVSLTPAHPANGITWVWGDGSANSTGNPPEKMFRKPGSYTTTVNVDTTAYGTLSATKAVAVYGDPVALANSTSCALLTDGTVKCWGSDDFGQLGDGSANDGSNSFQPVTVSGLSNVVALSGGYSGISFCALRSNGSVWCWGDNSQGQLGDGTTTNRNQPVQVSGLGSGVLVVSVGQTQACALKSDTTVVCWGKNGWGQLGDGTTTNRLTPVAVSGLSNAVGISLSYINSCALIAGGSVKCWGYNGEGQLGNGTTTHSYTPVTVSGLTGVADIRLFDGGACALKADKSVACWGLNDRGQLGNGSNTNALSPVAVSGLNDVVALSRGCALRATGGVMCWGRGNYGRLGNGSTSDSNVPVAVTGLGGVAALSANGNGACSLLSDGGTRCWGLSYLLGNNSTNDASTPVSVIGGNIFWK